MTAPQMPDDIKKKRDELVKLKVESAQKGQSDAIGHYSDLIQGFDTCYEIMAAEVERKDLALKAVGMGNDKLLAKIQQLEKELDKSANDNLDLSLNVIDLEKENTELKADKKQILEIGVEMQREVNRKQSLKLQAQSEIIEKLERLLKKFHPDDGSEDLAEEVEKFLDEEVKAMKQKAGL